MLTNVTPEGYQNASPYPHIVIDNFIDTELALEAYERFPKTEDIQWQRFHNEREKKLAFSDVENLPEEVFATIIDSLESPEFCRELARIVGVDEIHPDPDYMGGGLHRIERGGHLAVHSDFNFHPGLKMKRKINLLLFLNHKWKDEWGGHLELWNKDMTECVKKVSPLFNRCVIFTTDDASWHGHPHPLNCPEGEARKSIALYYYTNETIEMNHGTIFRRVSENGYVNTKTI